MPQRRSLLKLAAALAALSMAAGAHAQAKPELSKIRLGVGGKAALYYLPLSITERLGYFKEEGLEVEISDLQGGSKTMQALLGGSIDIASGAYEHTVHVQPKGQAVTAFVMQGRYPGFALGIAKAKAATYKSARDLKGLKIGVTSPGAGTQTFVEYLMAKEGLRSADASFIGVGSGATGAAAIRTGKLDAISNIDPLMTELETSGDVTIVVDTRTTAGTMSVFGTAMPAGTLYAQKSFIDKNPRTIQAMTNAMVRALLWIQRATPQQVGDAVPAAYLNNNRDLYLAAFAKVREGISPDGLFPKDGIDNTLRMLRDSDPAMKAATIRIDDTYTNRFVVEALKSAKR